MSGWRIDFGKEYKDIDQGRQWTIDCEMVRRCICQMLWSKP